MIPLLATLSVLAGLAASARPIEGTRAEVGDEITIEVSASGSALTKIEVVPPAMPDGLELGPALGPKTERRIEITGGRHFQQERLIWHYQLTATRPGTFQVGAFRVSDGTDTALTTPFEIRATGSFDSRKFVFVETRVDPRPRYVGEPIDVSLVAGVSEDWADRLLEGETTLGAPWMTDGLDGGAEPESEGWPAAGAPGVVQVRTATGQKLAMSPGKETRPQAGAFQTYTARRRFLPTRPGTVSVGSATFRAVIATRVERDRLFHDRLFAAQTKLARVSSAPQRIEVVPLPEDGKPSDFSGLVGRLALEVEAGPLDVKVGDSVRVKVRVSGGNVAGIALPRVELPGFKRFGVVEEVDVDPDRPSRTLVYDVAPVSPEVKDIPAFTFEVFDTAVGRYQRLRSKPISLKVRPGPAATVLSEPGRPAPPAAREGVTVESITRRVPGGLGGLATAIAAPLLVVGAWAMIGRRRSKPVTSDPVRGRSALSPPPVTPPPRSAWGEAISRLPSRGPDRAKALADAFAHHLAALARQAPESFVGVDLDRALGPFVADAGLRRAAADLIAESERSAFGGAPVAPDLTERAEALVGALERAFRRS